MEREQVGFPVPHRNPFMSNGCGLLPVSGARRCTDAAGDFVSALAGLRIPGGNFALRTKENVASTRGRWTRRILCP